MATAAQRKHSAEIARLLIDHEPKVHYAQRRPMRTNSIVTEAELRAALDSPAGITMDCSEAVTLILRLAGIRDPNGYGYSGYGNTESMLRHLPHYDDAKGASVGALVVLGPHGDASRQHVCMVLEPDREKGNPRLFSHGQERGPIAIRLATERKYHAPPVTFLSIKGL